MIAGVRRLGPVALALIVTPFIVTAPAVMGGDAAAQGRPEDEERGITVLNRPRPEFDPLGVRLGAFTFRGTATLDQGYNDNVFYSVNDRRGDVFSLGSARGRFTSNWSRHNVSGFAGVQRLQYYSEREQSYTNAEGGLSGRYDLTPDTELSAEASTGIFHVIRTDADAVASDKPVQYSLTSLGAGVTQRFGRYRASLRGFYRIYDYDEYSIAGRTVRGSGSFNDYDIYGATATAAYALGPFRTAFGGVRLFRISYGNVPQGFVDLSANAAYAFVGFNYDFDGVWRYEFDVGYLTRVYDESTIDTLSGISGTARVTWAPTALLAVRGTLQRTISQQLVPTPGNTRFNNGFFSTSFGLDVTYELYRNVLLTAGIEGRYDEFRSPRDPAWFLSETLGVNVLLDRNFRLGAFYLRQDTLNESGNNPSRNVIALRLSAEL
jgi:hypothetical protein